MPETTLFTKKTILFILGVVLICLSVFLPVYFTIIKDDSVFRPTICSSAFICIDSDDDFAYYNLAGNGSYSNPYVIENLTMIRDFSCGVLIKNTTKHFVIRNCFFDSSSGIEISKIQAGTAKIHSNEFWGKTGISLMYAKNTIETFQHGVLINVEDGYPETTIAWSRVENAFQLHPNLKYNYGSYKMAVLDTGFDEPTWNHFANKIPNYKLNLHLIDADGYSVDRPFAYDMYENLHHGTALMSLIIQMLERQAYNVYASIYMFICTDDTDGSLDSYIIEDQLQYIINFNQLYPSSPFKVISMSFGGSENFNPIYQDEINTLINTYGCIIVASSGNTQTESTMLEIENERNYPATENAIVGAGGYYGQDVEDCEENPGELAYYKKCRMSTSYSDQANELETNNQYIGSQYYRLDEYEQTVPRSEATVDVTAPSFQVEMICDIDDSGAINYIKATGTSIAAPQVAVAAYLGVRMKAYLDSSNPLTPSQFMTALKKTCEYDSSMKYLDQSTRNYWNIVRKPFANRDMSYYYSYHVGYGALDIGDLVEYIFDTYS